VRELKHVVWPTKKETGNFFVLVVIILTLFGIYLFLFSNVFSTIVFGLKDLVRWDATVNTEAVDTSFLDDISVQTASGQAIEIITDNEETSDEAAESIISEEVEEVEVEEEVTAE